MRRHRKDPKPTGKDVKITARDCGMTEALTRYEFLPTNHLIAFDDRYFSFSRARLKDFHHELRDKATRYKEIARPVERVRCKMNEQAFYRRGPGAIDLLKRYNEIDDATVRLINTTTIGRYTLNEHNAYAAMYVAQIELSAKKFGIRFISHLEIIKNSKAAAQAQPLSIPVTVDGNKTSLVPDAVFGLRYPSGEYKFFAVEYDRGTEAVPSKSHETSSWSRKFKGYKDARGKLKDYLNIPRWHILGIVPHVPKKINHPQSVLDLARSMNMDEFYLYELNENPQFEEVLPPDDKLFTGEWKGSKPLKLMEA